MPTNPPKLGPAPLVIPDGCRLEARMPDGRAYPVRLREAVHDLDECGRPIIGHVPATALGDFPPRPPKLRKPKPHSGDESAGLFDDLPAPAPAPAPEIVVIAARAQFNLAHDFASQLYRRGYAARAELELEPEPEPSPKRRPARARS